MRKINGAYCTTTGSLPQAEDGAIGTDYAPKDIIVRDVVEKTQKTTAAWLGRMVAEGVSGRGEKGAGKRRRWPGKEAGTEERAEEGHVFVCSC